MIWSIPRNTVLSLSGLNSALWSTRAAQAVMTPGTDRKPRHAEPPSSVARPDWDLIRSDVEARRQGSQILNLFGEVLDFDGNPVSGARIDIWQADQDGHYVDADQPTQGPFRGYGSVTTDQLGHFMFRTILPVAYSGRAPHIHARVTRPNGRQLETQIYLVDAPENERDWHYGSLGPSQQAALSIDPVERLDGDLDAGFNFVV